MIDMIVDGVLTLHMYLNHEAGVAVWSCDMEHGSWLLPYSETHLCRGVGVVD